MTVEPSSDLLVSPAPMSDGNDVENLLLVIDAVNNAVIPYSNPPKILFPTSLRHPTGRGSCESVSIFGNTLLTTPAEAASSSFRAVRAKVMA